MGQTWQDWVLLLVLLVLLVPGARVTSHLLQPHTHSSLPSVLSRAGCLLLVTCGMASLCLHVLSIVAGRVPFVVLEALLIRIIQFLCPLMLVQGCLGHRSADALHHGSQLCSHQTKSMVHERSSHGFLKGWKGANRYLEGFLWGLALSTIIAGLLSPELRPCVASSSASASLPDSDTLYHLQEPDDFFNGELGPSSSSTQAGSWDEASGKAYFGLCVSCALYEVVMYCLFYPTLLLYIAVRTVKSRGIAFGQDTGPVNSRQCCLTLPTSDSLEICSVASCENGNTLQINPVTDNKLESHDNGVTPDCQHLSLFQFQPTRSPSSLRTDPPVMPILKPEPETERPGLPILTPALPPPTPALLTRRSDLRQIGEVGNEKTGNGCDVCRQMLPFLKMATMVLLVQMGLGQPLWAAVVWNRLDHLLMPPVAALVMPTYCAICLVFWTMLNACV